MRKVSVLVVSCVLLILTLAAKPGEPGKTSASSAKENSSAVAEETSVLADGKYDTNLISKPTEFSKAYVSSIVFSDDEVIIDASFTQYDKDYNATDIAKAKYKIAINKKTKYLAGGGEGDPEKMSKAEFEEYIGQLMDSELGLSITIKNGYLAEIGIWS